MNLGKVVSGAVGSIAGSIVGGPIGAIAGAIGGSKSGVLEDNKEDQNRESEYQKKMAALGMDELGKYKDIASGKDPGITPEQQKKIDKQVSAEQAQMRQSLASMGIVDSTTRLAGERGALVDKIALQEQTRNATAQEHWNAFVKATGISEGSSQVLQAMNEQDRAEAMQIYSSLMSVGGKIAGASSGQGYKSVLTDYSNPVNYSDPHSAYGSSDTELA